MLNIYHKINEMLCLRRHHLQHFCCDPVVCICWQYHAGVLATPSGCFTTLVELPKWIFVRLKIRRCCVQNDTSIYNVFMLQIRWRLRIIEAEPSSNLQHKLHCRMGYVLASAKMRCFENSSGKLVKFLVKQSEDPLHKSWAGLSTARVWSCTVAVDKWIPILRYRDGFSINHNECIILSHSQTMVWKEKTPQNRSRGKHWHSWLCLTHWRLGDMAVISKV